MTERSPDFSNAVSAREAGTKSPDHKEKQELDFLLRIQGKNLYELEESIKHRKKEISEGRANDAMLWELKELRKQREKSKNDFLERIKSKKIPELNGSIKYRERKIKSGRASDIMRWEVEELKKLKKILEVKPPKQEKTKDDLTSFSSHEKLIAYAMLFGQDDAVKKYMLDPEKSRELIFQKKDLATLVDNFKKNPVQFLEKGRNNLQLILTDKKLSNPEDRELIFRTYLDAFFSLQVKLDRIAYPADAKRIFRNQVPEYVMEGLSDMGGDDEIDPNRRRSREKIRVNKQEIFAQAKELFVAVFQEITASNFDPKKDADKIKQLIINKVAKYVYTKMPYDRMVRAPQVAKNAGMSIALHRVPELNLAVCRHHALYTQVLLQAFGLESRLLKCYVSMGPMDGGGAHAANLVKVENLWHILDTTIPEEISPTQKIVFIKNTDERSVNMNYQNYSWEVPAYDKGTNTKRVYTSRHNMNYRIMDNQGNKK